MFNPYLFWFYFIRELMKLPDQNRDRTRIVNKWDMKNNEAQDL